VLEKSGRKPPPAKTAGSLSHGCLFGLVDRAPWSTTKSADVMPGAGAVLAQGCVRPVELQDAVTLRPCYQSLERRRGREPGYACPHSGKKEEDPSSNDPASLGAFEYVPADDQLVKSLRAAKQLSNSRPWATVLLPELPVREGSDAGLSTLLPSSAPHVDDADRDELRARALPRKPDVATSLRRGRPYPRVIAWRDELQFGVEGGREPTRSRSIRRPHIGETPPRSPWDTQRPTEAFARLARPTPQLVAIEIALHAHSDQTNQS
jgi:hypothetical protein